MNNNPNSGTPRGRKAIRAALEAYGAGRSILTDRHGEVIAGEHTAEQADAVGLKRRIVKTDGQHLVVVRRTDLDASDAADKRARGIAIADNRAGELNRRLDPAQIDADRPLLESAQVAIFAPVELDDARTEAERNARDAADAESGATTGHPGHEVRIHFRDVAQSARYRAWLARLAACYPDTTCAEERIMAAIP